MTTPDAIVFANNYPAVCVGSQWLHEEDCTVWTVADMMPHSDGNASIVIVQAGAVQKRKAVSASWLVNNPRFTLVDAETAEQLVRMQGRPADGVGGGTAGWLARISHRVLGWFRRA